MMKMPSPTIYRILESIDNVEFKQTIVVTAVTQPCIGTLAMIMKPLSVFSDDDRSKTAFVFAGGGSFGAIHVGMLHSLASRAITADMVVGSSVGALNGAYYAGNPTKEGIQRLDAIWRGLRRNDVFPLTLRTMTRLIYRRDFLFESDGLRQLVDQNSHLP